MTLDVALDVTKPEELAALVKLAFIAEQSHAHNSLSARLARSVVLDGEESAWLLAYFEGGEHCVRTVERVMAFLRAVRTERFRSWKVSYDQHGKEFTGSALADVHTTRAQHEWTVRRFGPDAGARITEYTDTLFSVPADPDRLPRDERHQAPTVPGAHQVHRFYRFDGEGPAALPDAAAVAYTRQHLYDARPRRYALPPVLLDTVRVVVARPVDVDQVAPLP